MHNKIYTLLSLDKNDEAEELLIESLQIAEKLFTKEHPQYTFILAELSVLWRNQGEFKKAELARLQADKIVQKFYGKESFNYAISINNLAGIYEDMGDYTQAKFFYDKSIQIRKKLYPNNLIRISSPQKNLARLLVKMGQYQQAHDLVSYVIDIFKKYNKDNLYNEIIKSAAFIGNGEDAIQCQLGLKQIIDLMPELEKHSEINWQRMLTEVWIGELAMKCNNSDMARQFLNLGLKKSKTIYKPGSLGQKSIEQRINFLLNQ